MITWPERYLMYVYALLAFCFLAFFTFRGIQADKRTYLETYSGEIKAVNKDVKGYWCVYVHNAWRSLSLDGACIDTLSVGDSISKQPYSYIIQVKFKSESYRSRVYACNKGHHFY